MLRRVILKFGAADGEPPLGFDPGPMTVFVGPNNSGKSLALRELEDLVDTGGDVHTWIVDEVDLSLPEPEDAKRMLLAREVAGTPLPTGWVRVVHLASGGQQARKRADDAPEAPQEQLVDLKAVVAAIEHGEERGEDETALLCRDFVSIFTIRLDGQTRLALTTPRLAGDPQDNPANHLAALFRDDAARGRIREITADALGLYFVIDATQLTHFRIRMSERPPLDDAEEQALDERARAFHGMAHDILELSDGVRAFTGLTAAILSADYRIMLVDEPEAFLHPPLTRKLGKQLTRLAAERRANVLASTHSPEFVMGCIQSGKRVNIVRLTYREGVPSARLLSADKLEAMMRDPLLRSTGVLGALFHEGAVICEADADRVFYAEINERLLAGGRKGADGCVFLNAQNKQTIRRILRPLREMGVPAVAVVDLDIFKGREDFRDLMKSAFVPEVFWEAWEGHRNRLHQKMKNEDYKSGRGVYGLAGEQRQMAELLLEGMAEYGVFIVPVGELECWMEELEVGGHGPEWLTAVFHLMGTDPTHPDYKHPAQGGVWRFMERVAAWVRDPHRKGMEEEHIPLDHRLPPPEKERRQRGPEPAAAAAPDGIAAREHGQNGGSPREPRAEEPEVPEVRDLDEEGAAAAV